MLSSLARELGASITGAGQTLAVPGEYRSAMFDRGSCTKWGRRLDILVHSIAFAPKSDLSGA